RLDVVVAGRGEHGGPDTGRGQRVDPDVEGGQLRRHRLGQADHRGLGRRVVGGHRQADETGHGGEVDDRAAAARLHERYRGTDGVEGAVEVDRDDAVEVLVGDAVQELRVVGLAGLERLGHPVVDAVNPRLLGLVRGGDTGGVHQDVELA